MINLLPNEKVILKTRPHFLVPLYWLLFVFSGWILMLVLTLLLPEEIALVSEAFARLSLFVFFFLALVIFLDWWNDRLYLTNLRVIKTRGIIGKKITSIPLDRIQDISVTFGILGRIFGFGDLAIESAGTYGMVVFENIPQPWKVKEKILGQIPSFRPP